MRKLIFLILIATASLFNGCKKYNKNVKDYYPKVTITSAALQSDGSVIVTGSVTSDGAGKIMYRGFCADVVSNPMMTQNQITINDVDASFTATYKSLDKGNKYYFKAWATNEYGYAISENEIKIDSVFVKPPTVPCSLPLDSFSVSNVSGTKKEKFNTKTEISGAEMTAYTNNHTIEIRFYKNPINGTYTMSSSPSDNGLVEVLVDQTPASNGGQLYVTIIDSKTIEVSVCSMNYIDDLFRTCTASMRLRFSYP